MELHIIKAPLWMLTGLDLEGKANAAVDEVSKTVQDQGRGLGARRNAISLERKFLQTSAFTSHNFPRSTGRSLAQFNERRFLETAPGVIDQKIVQPLEAEWSR